MSQTTEDIIILIDILVDCQGNEGGIPIFDKVDIERLGYLKSSILKKLNNEEETGDMK